MSQKEKSPNTSSGNYAEHQRIQSEILKKLGALPHIRLWKNATGMAFQGERAIAYGLKGSSDLIGILKPSGRFLAIEIKSGKARQSPAQIAFQKMVESFGGLYILARSENDVNILV